MSKTDNFAEQLQIHRDNVAKANGLNKAAVFDALSAAGITRVHINFDGAGDSGQIEFVGARAGEKLVEFPAITVAFHRTSFGIDEITTDDMPLREAVEELCYGYLEQEYDGWENNDGAFGEFTFDVAERRIVLEFNGRFTDYVQSNHAF
jgi:hypothetical protein